MKTIQTLRAAGCPLPVLEKASRALRDDWDGDLANAVLWWNGQDVVTITPAGEVVGLVTRRGQGIFADVAVIHVSCPIASWMQQIDSVLEGRDPIPVHEIRQRRDAAAAARAINPSARSGTA